MKNFVGIIDKAIASVVTSDEDDVKDAKMYKAREKAKRKVSASTRRLARHVGYALPMAATTSRELAEFMLKTTHTNVRCRYHEIRARNSNSKPIGVDTKAHFYGHAYPEQGSKKGGEELIKAEPGHLDCGCSLDEELLAFFLWKTVRLTSSNPELKGITCPQKRSDLLEPRSRRIQVEAFKMFAGLTIDELYEVEFDTEDLKKSMERLRLRQVHKFTQELKSMGIDIRVKFGEDGEYL